MFDQAANEDRGEPQAKCRADFDLHPGDRVRLHPARRADIFDIALDGKTATIVAIERDYENRIHVVVTIDDDPGQDLGLEGKIAHRFFFQPEEVELINVDEKGEKKGSGPIRRNGPQGAAHKWGLTPFSATRPRVLIAGIGNIFLGDDAFGVEVIRRLGERTLPEDVRAADFGIRGYDLACALLEGYELAVLVDAVPRGGAPGTLYVLEPELPAASSADAGAEPLLEMHNLEPVKVLRLAMALGGHISGRVLVIGCEPVPFDPESDSAMQAGLSPPVSAAVDQAIALIEQYAYQEGDLIHDPKRPS